MKSTFRFGYFILLVAIITLSFGLGVWVGINRIPPCFQPPSDFDFSLFWEAYHKLQEHFFNPSKIENQSIIYGAIKGMAESVGDSYTTFFSPQEAKKFFQDMSGSFEGIGAEIGIRKKMLTIISPIKNTPAEKAGLKSGDIILKIDDKETFNMTIEEAVNLIRGPKGTTVTLTISRDEWVVPKEIKITRDIINIPSLEWSIKRGEIAYIQIYQFNEPLIGDFKRTVSQILQHPIKGIILDLRNNPGGYLDTALEIAGWFLKEGDIITIEDFGGKRENIVYKNKKNGLLSQYPLVILINEGSASGSEILAGALRDNRNIKLIGTKTFGKGSVQELVKLRDNSFLKITIAHWLTPKGQIISDIGLEPDIKIERTEEDIKENKDPQLETALEIIQNFK